MQKAKKFKKHCCSLMSFCCVRCRWYWQSCWAGGCVQYWPPVTPFQTTQCTGATKQELTSR